ncbi:MAG: hypothetical protein ACM31M_00340 [Nitrososphaerota archaeon]
MDIPSWNLTGELVTRIKFVSTISKMGDKRIIIVPKDYHSELDQVKP